MKRIFAFILLICLFLTLLGYHFIFRYQISQAKADMKEYLRVAKLPSVSEFTFTREAAQSLSWENGDEFRYGNQMYDVLEKKMVNGVLVIRCIADDRESELVVRYLKENRPPEEGSPIAALIELVSVPYIITTLPSLEKPQRLIARFFPSYRIHIQGMFLRVLQQPPRFC